MGHHDVSDDKDGPGPLHADLTDLYRNKNISVREIFDEKGADPGGHRALLCCGAVQEPLCVSADLVCADCRKRPGTV